MELKFCRNLSHTFYFLTNKTFHLKVSLEIATQDQNARFSRADEVSLNATAARVFKSVLLLFEGETRVLFVWGFFWTEWAECQAKMEASDAARLLRHNSRHPLAAASFLSTDSLAPLSVYPPPHLPPSICRLSSCNDISAGFTLRLWAPAITIPIKRHVIADLQAMSSIPRTARHPPSPGLLC